MHNFLVLKLAVRIVTGRFIKTLTVPLKINLTVSLYQVVKFRTPPPP